MFVQVSQCVLHTFRQSSHQVYDGRIGRDICEETKHYWFVLTLSVLRRSLNARAVHPANKHSGSVKETNGTLKLNIKVYSLHKSVSMSQCFIG